MCDRNADEKKRVEKGSLLALREIPRRSGRVARRNVHGRREGKGGKPSLVRTGVNVIQDAGRGAADSSAARIPPGLVFLNFEHCRCQI